MGMNDILMLEKINESIFRLTATNNKILKGVSKHLERVVEGAQFNPRYQQGTWNGKISLLDRRTQTIPFGLWLEVITFCKTNNYQYTIKGTDVTELTTSDVFSAKFIQHFEDKIMSKTMPFKLRPYQIDSLAPALKLGKAINLLCTGSGKSVLIHYTMQLLRRTKEAERTLVIVPNISLVQQLFANIEDDYNYKAIKDEAYMLYGETKNKEKQLINSNSIDKPFLITTYQSIMRKNDSWFKQWDAVLIDEVHGVNSNAKSLTAISKKCYNAKYKLGYTGTLGLAELDKLTVLGYVGPVTYIIKNKQLMDLGFLSKIDIKRYIVRYKDEEFHAGIKGLSYVAEVKQIEDNMDRLGTYKSIFSHVKDGQNVLILVKHIKHLDKLQEYFETHPDYDGYEVNRIDGRVKGTKREEIRQSVIKSDDMTNTILLSNYACFSTGSNIPNLHHVVFGASAKGFIVVMQSLGRGLRLAENKESLMLHDVIDDFSTIQGTGRRVKKNALYKHGEARLKYYTGEGFECEDIDLEL
jgi:superfamily II DNA or RNA helicase